MHDPGLEDYGVSSLSLFRVFFFNSAKILMVCKNNCLKIILLRDNIFYCRAEIEVFHNEAKVGFPEANFYVLSCMIVPKLYKPETISFTDALKLKSVVHTQNLHEKAIFPGT